MMFMGSAFREAEQGETMKFKVYGMEVVRVTIIVEADSEEEAIDKAYEEYCGLQGYVGNGGSNKLIGTSQSEVSLEAGDDVEFSEAEAAN